MKTNYHTHTTRCMHATGSDEEYVLSAIKGGYQILGFSDHTPWKYRTDYVADMRMLPEELPGYVESLRMLREKYHDPRQKPDMVRQTRIFFLITLELFLLPSLHAAINFFRSSVSCFIKALDNKEIGIMTDILGIDRIAGAFAERQEIDCIQQIRLSHAVLSEETVQLGRKRKFHLLQVLIIEYRYAFQYHYNNNEFGHKDNAKQKAVQNKPALFYYRGEAMRIEK